MCLQKKLSSLLKTLNILLVLTISPLTLASVTQGSDEIQNTAIHVEMGVDYNRDGVIEFASDDNPFKPTFDKLTLGEPYVFWINDDDDKHNSETDGNDTPGTRSSFWGIDWIGEYNYANNEIDGTRDLIDFFPVAINFHHFFNYVPDAQDYTFRLKQEDQAVNIVFTEMISAEVDGFLRSINVNGDSNNLALIFGDWQDTTALHNIPVHQMEEEGIDLPSDFIKFIKTNNNQAVLLIEGRAVSDKPLLLEIINKNDQVILTTELPLKLVEVEDMYAIADIRGAAYKDKDGPNGYSAIDKAEELRAKQLEMITNKTIPTSFVHNKNFVFLHGYKVTPDAARAWHAEMFKRLFQSGSNAMYVGFSWDSNEGVLLDGLFDYWGNVENAFNVAETVTTVINQGLDGEITVAAHSLGNMVLGTAIAQYGLKAKHYFMLDPATPLEAYIPLQLAVNVSKNDGHNLMSHPDWHTFDNKEKAEALNMNPQRLWSSYWHELFDSSDNRSKLSWLGLFQTLSSDTELYQFYSSGEEVLAKSEGGQPGAWDSVPGWAGGEGMGQNSWIIQEKHKGQKTLADTWMDEEGGWGFNCKNPDMWSFICDTYNDTDIDTAYAMTDEELRLRPFFKPFSVDELFSDNTGTASDAAVQHKDHTLAFAIPALSHAAGVTAIDDSEDLIGSFDMMTMKDGWPAERTDKGDFDWLHSDAKDIAYRYVYKLYDTWVEKGNLK